MTREPAELVRQLLEALNAGDAERVVSFYEADGVIATDASQRVSGRDAIRTMVSWFLKRRPRFTLVETETSQNGDVALMRSQVTVSVADEGGKQTEFYLGP